MKLILTWSWCSTRRDMEDPTPRSLRSWQTLHTARVGRGEVVNEILANATTYLQKCQI